LDLDEFRKNHLDISQNIDDAIVAYYRSAPSTTDYSVMSVLEALNNVYIAETTGRTPRHRVF
jgi:hypothetical protein